MIQEKDSAPTQGALKEQICTDADEWYAAGSNVLPMKATKAKAPATSWKKWKTERIPESQHHKWFEEPKYHGLAIVGGVTFGDQPPVELFEFETKEIGREFWKAAKEAGLAAKEEGEQAGLLDRIAKGYMDESGGGGIHLLYRVEEVGPGVVLAAEPYTDEKGEPRVKTLIETKGRDHLIICAPTLGTVHEDEDSPGWQRLAGGPGSVVTISLEERERLFELARTFDKRPAPETPKGSGRPGDDYNERGPAIEELLEEAGGTLVRTDGEATYWARPDGTPGKVSASLGMVRDRDDDPMLHVFTSSWSPFEQDKNYSKFGVYTMVRHGGDFKAAAKALAAESYGAKQGSSSDGGDDGPTQGEVLLGIVEEEYDLGKTPGGDFYGVPRDGYGPYVARLIRGRGGSLRAELARKYAEIEGKAPGQQALANVILTVQGRCMQAPPVELALRSARYGDGAVLDLGDESGRVVVLRAGEWQIVPRSPVLFRRSTVSLALPEPIRGGDLDKLRNTIRIPEELWTLARAWMVFVILRPDLPCPVLLFMGEQGSIKTTNTKAVAKLIDPSFPQTKSDPRGFEDWVVAASGSRIVAIDNLSDIEPWFSDALCRGVTGEGSLRRSLYTDDDLAVIAFRRAFLLNAIALPRVRGDLADRLIKVDCPRVEESERREEEAVWADYEAAWPEMLGGLLDLAAEVLKVLPGVKVERPPRMADFARVVAALDQVLGTDALGTYRRLRSRLAVDVVEGDVVATAIRSYVAAHYERQAREHKRAGQDEVFVGEPWADSPGKLLEALTAALPNPDRPPRSWPGTPRGMTGALTRLGPSLRAVGVTVEYKGEEGHVNRRVWKLGLVAAEAAAIRERLDADKETAEPANLDSLGVPREPEPPFEDGDKRVRYDVTDVKAKRSRAKREGSGETARSG